MIYLEKQEAKKTIVKRLRTLKGHVAGIEKMVEEDKSCEDILIQIAAIKSSINKIGNIIVENHALDCLLEDGNDIDRDKAQRIIKTLINHSK